MAYFIVIATGSEYFLKEILEPAAEASREAHLCDLIEPRFEPKTYQSKNERYIYLVYIVTTQVETFHADRFSLSKINERYQFHFAK